MTPAENKAIYNRYMQEAFNEGRLETIDELLSPSYVYHEAPPGTPAGPAGIKQVVTMFRSAFPDLKIEIVEQIAEGDLVASRSIMLGTHTGSPIFGIEASGNAVAMHGMTMVKVRDGKVTDSWVRNDVGGLMEQLKAKK